MCETTDMINHIPEEEERTPYDDRNAVSRYKMREQAFILCFERLFSDTDIDELADNAGDARDVFVSDYALACAKGVDENREQIDAMIASKLKKGWRIERISKVSLSLLRVAVYEMLYVDEVPVSVSINEAVELAKKYSVQDDASFINGVLGAIAKEL